MIKMLTITVVATGLLLAGAAPAQEQQAGDADRGSISEITVEGRRVANTSPAGTFATIATLLRFDPQTELQSRGLPEGQADVTVHGGLFENTGFKVGAVTVIDPQTGHYAAGLPVDPGLLSIPDVVTGIDNALAGFNSNIATIRYLLRELRQEGQLTLGAGNDELLYGSLRAGFVRPMSGDADLALGVNAAGSRSDGDVEYGDHEFQRYNLQAQWKTDRTQSDLIIAYEDKFFGWPGAYTGFASLPETDDTQTTLFVANHRSASDRGYWQAGAFYRQLEDDYDFDRRTRESGAPGSFDHKTRVYAIGVDGLLMGNTLDWHFAGQFTSDELLRSTDLTNSDFTSRSYLKLSLVPSRVLELPRNRKLTLRFGATADISNRDENAVSPVLGAALSVPTASGTRSYGIEYVATTQLPGYTVLGSGPSGLFGGNPELGRETARQLLFSVKQQADDWHGTLAFFYRRDNDLVDWTFSSDSPFVRQANAVDLDVVGTEVLYSKSWESMDLIAGYTFLDKDADYGSVSVDASFYALNFAEHRATLALRYRLGRHFELRIDNEYRDQANNLLRQSADRAYLLAASLTWQPDGSGFGLVLASDNLTDDDYEPFPGTPAVGRQVSLSGRFRW